MLVKDHIVPIAVFGVLAIVFFLPAMLTGQIVAPTEILQQNIVVATDGDQVRQSNAYDVVNQFFPWREATRHAVTQGQFPLWNPYEGLGAPLLANPQAGVLNPLNLLYLLSGNPRLVASSYWFQLVIASVGMYYLLLTLGHSLLTRYAGGIAFAYSGALLGWIGWPHAAVFALFPAGLVFCHGIIYRGCHYQGVALASVIALAIYFGHPGTVIQVVFFLFLFTLGCFFEQKRSGKPVRRTFGIFCFSIVAGLGLASLQLIPTFEYVVESTSMGRVMSRSSHLTTEYFVLNLFPDFLGNYHFLNAWFAQSREVPEVGMGYVGVSAVVYAVCVWWLKEKQQMLYIFGLLGLIGLVLAYSIPGISNVADHIPVLSSSSYHRMEFFWGFCVLVIAMYGVDAIFSKKIVIQMHGLKSIIVIVLIGSLLFWFARNIFMEKSAYQDAYDKYLIAVFVLFILNLFCVGVVIRFRKNKFIFVAVLGIIACETYLHSYNYLDLSRESSFYPESEGIRYLREQGQGARVFSLRREYFPPNLGTFYGVNQMRVDNPLKPAKSVVVGRATSIGDETLLEAFRKVGVSHYIVGVTDNGSDAKLAARKAFREFFDVGNANTLTGLTVDLITSDYVMMKDTEAWTRGFIVTNNDITENRQGEIELESDVLSEPVDELRITGNSTMVKGDCVMAEGCLVVLSDTYYPGWKVFHGNEELSIVPVKPLGQLDLRVRGVFVDRGAFVLDFHFQPKSVLIGAYASTLFLFGLLGSLFWIKRCLPRARHQV